MKEFLILRVCVFGEGGGGMWTEWMGFRVETVEEFVQGNDRLDRPCEK